MSSSNSNSIKKTFNPNINRLLFVCVGSTTIMLKFSLRFGVVVVVVFVATLGPEFVLGFALLESSLSQLVLVSALLGLYLVSSLGHVESAEVHLNSALVHLTIQTI
ncbi:hypothetical protein Tco_1303177 [Tanacetum coccineum]